MSGKKIDQVPYYADRMVGCPICEQEFWGYSEIIFCSCGWTFIREEDVTGENFSLSRQELFQALPKSSSQLAPRRVTQKTGRN